MPALPLLLAGCLAANASEWRSMVGGEFNADSHGVADVGWRSGPWQAQLVTDTLDVRWQPERDGGRSWVAARAALGAAGLMSSPWSDGAPLPGAALSAFYAGPEGGNVWYLRDGLYTAVDGRIQWWWFGATRRSARTIPDRQLRGEVAHSVGWWSTNGHVWLRGGGHLAPVGEQTGLDPQAGPEARTVSGDPVPNRGAPVQPFVQFVATSRPEAWKVAPRAELRAGWSRGQDAISRTRLGGLNPYVVPVAGAAWAEFWVDTYAAVRFGPSLQAGPIRIDAVIDAALWNDALDWGGTPSAEPADRAVGMGVLTRLQPNRLFLDLDAGVAPRLRRPVGSAWSVWSVLGVDWGSRRIRQAP